MAPRCKACALGGHQLWSRFCTCAQARARPPACTIARRAAVSPSQECNQMANGFYPLQYYLPAAPLAWLSPQAVLRCAGQCRPVWAAAGNQRCVSCGSGGRASRRGSGCCCAVPLSTAGCSARTRSRVCMLAASSGACLQRARTHGAAAAGGSRNQQSVASSPVRSSEHESTPTPITEIINPAAAYAAGE